MPTGRKKRRNKGGSAHSGESLQNEPGGSTVAVAAEGAVPEEIEYTQKAEQLKSEGDSFFTESRYREALSKYADAMKRTPSQSELRSSIRNNRAACFLSLHRHRDAIAECDAALDAHPGSAKVLARRSRAYELLDKPKQALDDIENALKHGYTGDDAKRARERLRNTLCERKPKQAVSSSNAASASSASSASSAASSSSSASQPNAATAHSYNHPYAQSQQRTRQGQFQRQQQQQQQQMQQMQRNQGNQQRAMNRAHVPLHFVSETEGEHHSRIALNTSYTKLLEEAKRLYPDGEQEIALRYIDRDGDRVTICSQNDFQTALQMAMLNMEEQRRKNGTQNQRQQQLPVVRLEIDRVPSSPPDQDQNQSRNTSDDVIEIDEWLLELSNLFKKELGLGDDEYVDINGIGLEKCFHAVERVLQHENADALLAQGCEQLEANAANAFFNMGNVEMCRMRKIVLGKHADGSENASSEAVLERAAQRDLQACTDMYNKAMQHYSRAVEIKPDHLDTIITQSQQAHERARLLHIAYMHKKGKQADDIRRQLEDVLKHAIERAERGESLAPEPRSEADVAYAEGTTPLKYSAVLSGAQALIERSALHYKQGKEWESDLAKAGEKLDQAELGEKEKAARLKSHPHHQTSGSETEAASVS